MDSYKEKDLVLDYVLNLAVNMMLGHGFLQGNVCYKSS